MGLYADFDYYKDTYRGEAIQDEATYNRLALEACLYLDSITFGRVKAPYLEEIKMAVCALSDINLLEFKINHDTQIASESVGPHSISYVKKSKKAEDFQAERLALAKLYLANTGLLYRGLPQCNL